MAVPPYFSANIEPQYQDTVEQLFGSTALYS